jgi:cytochrome b6-f complex subunit 4
MLCSKLSKGMGHNYYGEPAWPNDILYIFPIVIFGIRSYILGLAIHEYQPKHSIRNSTWVVSFSHILGLLRILSDKFIGILGQFYLPGILLIIPFGENLTRYQNPFRRCVLDLLFDDIYSIWLSIGPLSAIIKALPLVA